MSKVIKDPQAGKEQTGSFRVNCHKLDGLMDLFTDRHIDLLKIDVESSELDVLEGAQQLLKEQKIHVAYIEVGFRRDGTQQAYFATVDEFFQKFGYRIFKIYEQMNEWPQDSPLLRRCNFSYMSPRFAGANPFKLRQEIIRLRKEIDALKLTQTNIETENATKQ